MKEELEENMEIFPAKIAIKLYQKFRTRAVAPRVYWRGDFHLFKDFKLEICLYKKTSEEKMPSLKTYSTVADFS